MRVIGVVDLLAGRAVHARAGCRGSYQPVRAVAGSPIEPGDALALARAYVNRLGVTELYAADLDAILARLRVQPDASASLAEAPDDDRAAPRLARGALSLSKGGAKAAGVSQDALVAAVAALGAPLWLDAGVSSADQARHVFGLGAARAIVGLETLASYQALGAICAALGGDRVAFSLDLRDGEPVIATGVSGDVALGEPAHVVASRAANAGVGAMIVLDLARVGTGTGLDLALIARVRASTPGLMLLAGGGVRGYEDLARLADAGCDGALVATALHDGRLGATDVAAAHRLGHGRQTR